MEPAGLGWRAGAVEVAHGGAVVDGVEGELEDVAYGCGDGVGGEGEAAEGNGDFGGGGGEGICQGEEQGG